MTHDFRFSKRVQQKFEPNLLTQARLELEATNISLIDLTASNPTLCGFQHDPKILERLAKPENLIYIPHPRGLKAAREAVVQYYASKGIALGPEQIFLTANTSEAYSFIFRLMLNPGDILLAPQPSYPLLDHLCQFNDVSLERYELTPPSWEIDWDSVSKKKFSGFLVVHPNNPTGSFVHDEDRRKILARLQPDQFLISDEVFLDYPLEDLRYNSFAGTSEILTFTVSGISKILALPQMKLSWIVVSGPKDLEEQALARLEWISDTYLSASTPIQNALPDWFKSAAMIQAEIKERIRKNYRILKTRAAGSQMELIPAQGGWTVIIKLPNVLSDEEYALSLLKKYQLLVHPGYFYELTQESHIILSLLPPENLFQQGLEILLNQIKH